MRWISVTALVGVAAICGPAGVAAAAPKDYCTDLGGAKTGSTCAVHLADPGYSLDVSVPLDYPDQKSIADYVTHKRRSLVTEKSAGDPPAGVRVPTYEVRMSPTEYTSSVPSRGTQTVVFTVVDDAGGADPLTYCRAFNWDLGSRKAITYAGAPGDETQTPLWRVDDPLETLAPIVAADLQQQLAPPPVAPGTPPTQPCRPAAATPTTTPPPPLPIAAAALYDPTNYQNFAIVDDGVIFFFEQGALLPASAGPLGVLVPRSAIDPLMA